MTFREVIADIIRVREEALEAAANAVITVVTPFVPIASGDLRRSQKVVKTKNGIEIDWDSEPYARFQYNADESKPALHHLGTRGDYRSISASDTTYSKRYRSLKGENKLTPSRAKWFDAVLEDPVQLRRISQVYTNVIKRKLK